MHEAHVKNILNCWKNEQKIATKDRNTPKRCIWIYNSSYIQNQMYPLYVHIYLSPKRAHAHIHVYGMCAIHLTITTFLIPIKFMHKSYHYHKCCHHHIYWWLLWLYDYIFWRKRSTNIYPSVDRWWPFWHEQKKCVLR